MAAERSSRSQRVLSSVSVPRSHRTITGQWRVGPMGAVTSVAMPISYIMTLPQSLALHGYMLGSSGNALGYARSAYTACKKSFPQDRSSIAQCAGLSGLGRKSKRNENFSGRVFSPCAHAKSHLDMCRSHLQPSCTRIYIDVWFCNVSAMIWQKLNAGGHYYAHLTSHVEPNDKRVLTM